MPVLKGVFFSIFEHLHSKPVTILVDVDGVLLYSPIIIPIALKSRKLLAIAMKLYRSKRVRRLVDFILKPNPYAVAYVKVRARQGYGIVYCTGRTADTVPELVKTLVMNGLQYTAWSLGLTNPLTTRP